VLAHLIDYLKTVSIECGTAQLIASFKPSAGTFKENRDECMNSSSLIIYLHIHNLPPSGVLAISDRASIPHICSWTLCPIN
jgi:hypothetical protein